MKTLSTLVQTWCSILGIEKKKTKPATKSTFVGLILILTVRFCFLVPFGGLFDAVVNNLNYLVKTLLVLGIETHFVKGWVGVVGKPSNS